MKHSIHATVFDPEFVQLRNINEIFRGKSFLDFLDKAQTSLGSRCTLTPSDTTLLLLLLKIFVFQGRSNSPYTSTRLTSSIDVLTAKTNQPLPIHTADEKQKTFTLA